MGAPVPKVEAAENTSAEAFLSSFESIAAKERRKHASVYNYWLSIRGKRHFPSIRELDPLEIADAGPASILLEMIGGGEDAEIRHVGQAVKNGGDIQRISEAPNPSLLSCIHAQLPIVAACRQPLAFEQEFATDEGKRRCWVSLLPFSANGSWIDYVYGFVSLDGESASAEESPEVAEAELEQSPVSDTADDSFKVPLGPLDEATEPDEANVEPTGATPDATEEPSAADSELVEDASAEHSEELEPEPEPVEDLPMTQEEPEEQPVSEPVDSMPEPEIVDEPDLEPLDLVLEPLEGGDEAAGQPLDELEAPAPEVPDGLDAEPDPGLMSRPVKPGFSAKLLEGLASVGFYGRVVQVEPHDQISADDAPPEAPDAPEAPEAAETVFEATLDQPSEQAEGPLQIKLNEVRALAEEARQAQIRSQAAIVEGLSAAYDFALDAEQEPEEYLRLVEAQGLKIQLRSPMKPVVKLGFDGMCDAETIAQLEAVLAWALKHDLPRGTLSERIDAAGGIGPLLESQA